MKPLVVLLSALLPLGSPRAQTGGNDVLLLTDGTVVRGTVTRARQYDNVNIRTADGIERLYLRSEVRKVVRVPTGIPDSLLTREHVAFLPPAAEGEEEQDVLFLQAGKFLRGILLHPPDPDPARLWTADGSYVSVAPAVIVRVLRLPASMSDSTIDVLYVHPPPELLADNFRILTLAGGLALPLGEFEHPRDGTMNGAGTGYAIGLHASIRFAPMWRSATSLIYSKHPTVIPQVVADYTAVGNPSPQQVIWALTGAEFRTEGTSPWKGSCTVQGGIVSASFQRYDLAAPQTYNHPAATGSVTGSSGTGFAWSFGLRLARGPLSITAQYLSGTVPRDYLISLQFEYGPEYTWPSKGDQPIRALQFTLGFSPF